MDGAALRADWCLHSHGEERVLDLWLGGEQHTLRTPLVRRWARSGAASVAAGTVATPMPGKVVKVFVGVGDCVVEGDALVAVEAMKMEHTLRAPCAGTVAELHAFVGAQVDEGHVLAVVVRPQEQEAAAG